MVNITLVSFNLLILSVGRTYTGTVQTNMCTVDIEELSLPDWN
jgi:hypothetical protein